MPLRVWGLACLTVAGLFGLPDIDQLPRIALALIEATGSQPAKPQPTGRQSATTLTGTATVIDGDTIEIHGQRIRLFAYDAPETRQSCRRPDGSTWRCGVEASRKLDALIGRSTISCQRRQTDRYGRMVASCSRQGEDLGQIMVSQGWAVAYRQYGKDYIAAEEAARRAKRGIWAGSFEMPWDFRRKKS